MKTENLSSKSNKKSILTTIKKVIHKKEENNKVAEDVSFADIAGENDDRTFEEARKNIKDRVAPDGINPNPLEYMVIEDAGQKAYCAVLYVQAFPKSVTFAVTFAPLFNYTGVDASVYIDPLPVRIAVKMLDKRITALESERLAAVKDGDTNRIRKISEKQAETEEWAKSVETGATSLFKVKIMFLISAKSVAELQETVTTFAGIAREQGIELSNAYSVIPEAYLCSAPFNKMYDFKIGPFAQSVIKYHIMDIKSLSDLYNHTEFNFSHKDGVLVGRDMHTGVPFYYDHFEPSHNGYAVIIAGGTGTGKSTLVKSLISRNIDFGDRFVAIDYDSPGTVGEYAQLTLEQGGVVHSISATSKTILNLFELNVEIVYDELLDREYEVLDVKSKITDVTNIIITMIKSGKNNADFATDIFLEDKVSELVEELYTERGIIDGDVNSLYTEGQVINDGHLVTGKIRKKLPTITEFVYKAIVEQKQNADENYSKAFALIIAGMRQYVRELYFCKDTLRRFSREEYEKMSRDGQGAFYFTENNKKHYLRTFKGIKPYFDGESNITINLDTPMIDFDISQLPKPDKPVAQQVIMNYVEENIVKKNSIDPKKVRRLGFIVDEAHRAFIYPEARAFMNDSYRTSRKHHVSVWTITQALKDYDKYPETRDMISNAASTFLLKQAYQDKEFLLKTTPLTPTQVDELLSLGGDTLMYNSENEETQNARRGEVCLIDNGLVAFIKVDVLWSSERRYVTTDAESRKKLYQEKHKK